MATGGKPSEYQVLLGLEKELVERIIRSGTDVEVLTSRAVSKGLIPPQSLKANATSTAPSRRERAEQFVARVLEAIRGDPTGERTTLFLQILDDLSLSALSQFVRSKLAGSRRVTGDTHRDAPPLAHRPGPPHQPPGGAYGGQPKLVPPDEEDSGIVREGETNDNNDHANSGVEAATSVQHQMAPANPGGAGFTPLSNGVIAVPDEHSDNLAVILEDDPPAIPETQPHTSPPVAASNPMITGMTNPPPVLSAVAQIQQENQELRDRVKEKSSNEECLQQQLSQIKLEKEESEQLLEQKDRELEKVKRDKDEEIQTLKAQIEEKEKKMRELQRRLSDQEQQNEALKAEHKAEIAKLKEQLEKTEEKYLKKILKLTEEKYDLELELERMRTREAQMKQQAAELKVEVAEQKQKNTELQAQQEQKQQQEKIDVLEKQHKDSLTKNKQLEEEIARLRKKYDTEPDTS